MPFLMLAKCAEAQAIRKGWPEDLSNTFVGEEIEQAALSIPPKPRRIVFDRARDLFMIYADRKLMTPATIARIETQFHLPEERIEIQSDFHYQSTVTTIVLET
jgi:hypothetical protein